MLRRPPKSTPFPYPTLSRSAGSSTLWPPVRTRLPPTKTMRASGYVARSSPIESSRITSELLSSAPRSEEHTSELQSRQYLVCRLLLEKKKQELFTAPSQVQA